MEAESALAIMNQKLTAANTAKAVAETRVVDLNQALTLANTAKTQLEVQLTAYKTEVERAAALNASH